MNLIYIAQRLWQSKNECSNLRLQVRQYRLYKKYIYYLNNQATTIPIKNFPEINQDDFDIVVLPGVGNFQHASEYLHENLNFQKFKEWLSLNKKVICICLGFQLLFEESEESDNKSNKYPGIGIIPGKITSLSGTDKLS